MIAFLADENISPESADHLENLGYPCHSLRREGPWRLSDSEIVAMAQREGRIILTHDLDFGEIYYFAMGGEVGIIVLRLRHQTVEAVSDVGALPQGTGLNRRGAPARSGYPLGEHLPGLQRSKRTILNLSARLRPADAGCRGPMVLTFRILK